MDCCQKALESGRCLGCQALENPMFVGNANCEANKTPSAKECLRYIKETLGIQESLLDDWNADR